MKPVTVIVRIIMTETTVQEIVAPSKKRQVAAVVTATTVGIALSIGTNVLIGKLTTKISEKIAPTEIKPTTEEDY